MNVNDSEKMHHILSEKGYSHTDDETTADIIIINSCAVREKPQEKIFSYAGRMGKDKIIIAAGCVAQSEKDKILKRSRNIDYVVGTHQYYQIGEITAEIIENRKKASGAAGVKAQFSKQWQELVPESTARTSPVSGYISIMEGCNNFCSYCIVPFTRGREKHRPFEKIMSEARELAARGYKEIILLGQNVNNWEDKDKDLKFTDLLDRMAAAVDVRWIRFITSYPGYYDNELMEVMAAHPKIARNIHFPAQSGSTRILKQMNRIYTRPQYLDIIERFKKRVPDITFSSDFITGYPGETENDFRLTLSLVEKVEYENIFSFMYSPRPHTRAFKMKDDISPEIKKQRLHELQETQKQIQLRNNKAQIGKTVEVLVTGHNPKRPGEVIARTVNYRVVNVKSGIPAGQFTDVLIEAAGPYSLRGSVLQ
jgi:tRNA-2-methylthio-N6-dimethylallyladenosine synthase